MADARALSRLLADRELRLEPLAAAHREPLRTACAADREIWEIYPVSFLDDAFDPGFDRMITDDSRRMLAARAGTTIVGMSGFLNLAAANRALEIGSTYLVPATRGTGLNGRMKRLMIGHALACGFDRIEFRVDARNSRSQAALAKLGAMREGMLRRDRVTWTGHARDTVIFSILRDEWQARSRDPI